MGGRHFTCGERGGQKPTVLNLDWKFKCEHICFNLKQNKTKHSMSGSVESPKETETRPFKGSRPRLQTRVSKSKIPLPTGKNQRLPGEMADSRARAGNASLLGSRQEEAGCSGWGYQGPRANLRAATDQHGSRSSQRDSSWNTLYDHACSDQTMLKAT